MAAGGITGRFPILGLLALCLLVRASPARGGPCPTPGDLIVIASAETRGEILPCDCPQQRVGGLAWRAALLEEVAGTGCPRILIELGEVFPPPDSLADPVRWAATVGTAYGRMGYDLIVLGEEDIRLGRQILDAFEEAFLEVRPTGVVARPSAGGAGSMVSYIVSGPDTNGGVACLVVWPPVDPALLAHWVRSETEPAQPSLVLLHSSLLHAKELAPALSGAALLAAGDGAQLPELKWMSGLPVSGPGARGRTLSFTRLSRVVGGVWSPVAHMLIPVAPREGGEEVARLIDELAAP
ncbi:MAG: hypothetical protein GF355_14955 [Candidatus Eisenbacteria bacterium]|nr:hypothetical protein [Candidatus Eisenbacteria bacterium]